MYGRGSHDRLTDSGDWRERIVLTEHRYMREDLRLGLSLLVSVAELAGVATPLAKSFLAIGGAICGEDFMKDGRTLASLGLGGLDRDRTADPAARGFSAMTAARPAIACLGAGRMGRGIAVAFAYAGHAVTMIDVKARSAEQFATLEAEALGEVRKTLASLARFGLLMDKDAEAIIARVSVVPAQDMAAALADAGIVFEGVPEVVELKREVLAAASKCVGPDVIIASTTSTILVDDLSGAVDHPERFLNVHWLNPAYLIPLVEISPGAATDPAVIAAGQGAARRHRQGAGGVRRHARLHRAAHPGAGHERGGAHGGGRRRQRRGYRQGDPLRFRFSLRGDGPAGIHRLGRRRHSLLRQPLSRGRARQRPLSRAGGDFDATCATAASACAPAPASSTMPASISTPIASSASRRWSTCSGISAWRGRRC